MNLRGLRQAAAGNWDSLILTVIAFGGSFDHWVHLADAHGQRGYLAPTVAVCVDLGVYRAARERQRDLQTGRERRGWLSWPTLIMIGGIALTLAGNVASAQPSPWGVITALIPGAFLLLAISLTERRAAERARRQAAADAERERQAEAERKRQAELAAERARQAEAGRQAERQAEAARQRQADLARRKAAIVTSPSAIVTPEGPRALPPGPSAAGHPGAGDTGEPGGPRSATEVMRAYWDRAVAAGRVPTGAELRDAAGCPQSSSLGRQKRAEWLPELESRGEMAGARS